MTVHRLVGFLPPDAADAFDSQADDDSARAPSDKREKMVEYRALTRRLSGLDGVCLYGCGRRCIPPGATLLRFL